MTALDEIRSLVHVRDLLECELGGAARRAVAEGVDRTALARALGIARPGVYRHFQQPAEAVFSADNDPDREAPAAGSDANGVLRLNGDRRRMGTGTSSARESA